VKSAGTRKCEPQITALVLLNARVFRRIHQHQPSARIVGMKKLADTAAVLFQDLWAQYGVVTTISAGSMHLELGPFAYKSSLFSDRRWSNFIGQL
jgi:hypothetical protein